MINDIRNIVNFILNKESRGYITPLQYNSFAKQAQQEIVDFYYQEYNKALIGRELRRNHTELVNGARESIDAFVMPPTALTFDVGSGLFLAPADVYQSITLMYNNIEIDSISRDKLTYHLQDDYSGSSVFYPTYVQYQNNYKVYPETIQANVKLVYFRTPKDPNWTYNMFGDNPVFNPDGSGFQDFEVGFEDKFKLITKILKYCGVNLRETEVVQVATMLEQSLQSEKIS